MNKFLVKRNKETDSKLKKKKKTKNKTKQIKRQNYCSRVL